MGELCTYVFAPNLSYGQVATMNRIIEDYICMRKKLFPEVRLRPKHHYLCHYAYLTVVYGPLSKVSTLRFESKHQYFKRTVRNCQNFINLTKTLTEKHQMFQALLLEQNDYKDVEHTESAQIDQVFEDELHHIIERHYTGMKHSTTIKIRNILYKKGMVLLYKVSDGMKLFGRIRTIIHGKNIENIQFVLQKLIALGCSRGCFNLEDSEDLTCVSFDTLPLKQPLTLYNICGVPCIVIKYQPLELY